MLADSQGVQVMLGNYHEQQGYQRQADTPDEPWLVSDNSHLEDMVGERPDAKTLGLAELKGFLRE
ncbi:MAG TPA: hypothetical protein VNN15_00205 [Solirubrobacterales bacterium]|nr:hypothetical protein [Solirubrobacterales bacterium]